MGTTLSSTLLFYLTAEVCHSDEPFYAAGIMAVSYLAAFLACFAAFFSLAVLAGSFLFSLLLFCSLPTVSLLIVDR